MNSNKSTAIWILVFAAVTIPLLAFAIQKFNILTPNASSSTPQRITFANGTETSMSIGWATPGALSIGTIQWGDTTALGNTARDVRDIRDNTTKARRSHLVSIAGLLSNKVYYYRLMVGSTPYPAANEPPATFRTLAAPVSSQSASLSIYGDLSVSTTDSIVYAYAQKGTSYTQTMPLAVAANTDGTWLINLNNARNTTNGDYISVTSETQVVIVTEGGNTGSVTKRTAANSPVTLEFEPSFTQDDVTTALGTSTTTTPTTTITATTTATPTITPTKHQDVPLLPLGTTPSTTPTATVTGAPVGVSKQDILSAFAIPSMSNVTDSLISIMWISETPESEVISYGSSANSLTSTKKDDRDSSSISARRLHHMTLLGLSSNTTYLFKTANNTTVRSFSTPAPIALPSTQTIAAGTITNSTGDCVVRTQLKRGSTYSSVVTTLPTSGTAWAVNLAPIRNTALTAYFSPSSTDTVLTNAICVTSSGDIWYQATSDTVQNAVAKSTALTLVKLQ